jgi:thymidylate kinase
MRMLIVFSGTDGAGKSTQIARLEEALHLTGERTARFWARGGYTPLFSFLKAGLRRAKLGSLPKPGASTERVQHFQSARVRKIWLTIAILDLVLCYAIWLRAKLWMGRAVLCDRYLEDTLLDFGRNFPQERVGQWKFWRFLVALSPKPNHRFLLLVPPEESARRGKLKNEPFPDSPETLAWRYAGYQDLAKGGEWLVLDCLQSIDQVQVRIRERVLK